MTERTCSECDKVLGPRNKGGRCKRHAMLALNADPAFQAKRLTGFLNLAALEKGSIKRKLAAKKAARTRLSDPAARERLARFMREVVQPKGASHVGNYVEMGLRSGVARRAWCPEGYWDQYRVLIKKGIRKADAVPMILEQARRDEAKLSPFERQERALKRGAKLVTNDNRQVFGTTAQRRWG